MISVTDSNCVNQWIVSKVMLEHNHELVSKTSNKITSHRYIGFKKKNEIQ
jgi:hypothetical protein